MAAPSEDIVAALVASDSYSSPLAPRTSQKGHALFNALKGGKTAKPNVTAAVKLAEELEAHLMAIQRQCPAQQKPSVEPQHRAYRGEGDDLPSLLGSASRDARYLKQLTSGGWGMSRNVVEPLRVVRELRPKLATIQARWPELQVEEKEEAIRLTLVGRDEEAERAAEEAFQRLKGVVEAMPGAGL
ncbi:hypothetical protein [Rhizobium rosettiformans]|uniref:hypothetical protein n=1 Tax=Rhizobium rosettiformans TaxID=1368430 RepID=UPI00285DF90F|nr:hypothetical protein [Rhizobium rosettiformans]MDR7028022.1 hypothetical protein [Rhizobium rosettiformans]MDR7064696.1 hypothetical protein [Rhizobium rosettiformans]